jgi:hypothetical protein
VKRDITSSTAPPTLGGRSLQALVTHLEAAIADQYGLHAGAHSALTGRCFLACATLSRWAQEQGERADIVCGQLVVGDPSNPNAHAVHVTKHAWLVLDRWLVDPTIVQVEREHFGGPLANLGPILCVPLPPGHRASRDTCRFVDPARPVEMLYQPERRPERLAIYRAMPDRQPRRVRGLIRALNSALTAVMPSSSRRAR